MTATQDSWAAMAKMFDEAQIAEEEAAAPPKAASSSSRRRERRAPPLFASLRAALIAIAGGATPQSKASGY